MGNVWMVVVAYQLVCAAIGYVLGRDRQHPVLGAVLGYVFGVIGLFLLVLAGRRPASASPPGVAEP